MNSHILDDQKIFWFQTISISHSFLIDFVDLWPFILVNLKIQSLDTRLSLISLSISRLWMDYLGFRNLQSVKIWNLNLRSKLLISTFICKLKLLVSTLIWKNNFVCLLDAWSCPSFASNSSHYLKGFDFDIFKGRKN